MLGMGDYDSCTEKYFRICSRAPIPDMHIAREPGIQLLRLQAAIAGLRTYFCARGASVCERLCQGTCGIEKPMTLSEHPTCTVVMQGRGILSTAESICKCRLDSGRGKNSSRHFFPPIYSGKSLLWKVPFLPALSSFASSAPPPRQRLFSPQSVVHLQRTIPRGETNSSDAKKMECLFIGSPS